MTITVQGDKVIECRKKHTGRGNSKDKGVECKSAWGVQRIAAVWLPPGCELGPDDAWLVVIHRYLDFNL